VAVVDDQVAVDDIGEMPLQAPAGLLRSLGLGQLALVEGLPWADVSDLADRDQVQGGIELAVATRFKRCRRRSPLEASTGAVPV
jgi:hypothetical protein